MPLTLTLDHRVDIPHALLGKEVGQEALTERQSLCKLIESSKKLCDVDGANDTVADQTLHESATREVEAAEVWNGPL
jgi:hypothetical protein